MKYLISSSLLTCAILAPASYAEGISSKVEGVHMAVSHEINRIGGYEENQEFLRKKSDPCISERGDSLAVLANCLQRHATSLETERAKNDTYLRERTQYWRREVNIVLSNTFSGIIMLDTRDASLHTHSYSALQYQRQQPVSSSGLRIRGMPEGLQAALQSGKIGITWRKNFDISQFGQQTYNDKEPPVFYQRPPLLASSLGE